MSTNGHIRYIPLTKLRPGPWQPRRFFDEESLAELGLSIKAKGVLTPLRVIRAPTGTGYLIVAGERRWRAAGLAGISKLPCLVVDDDAGEGSLLELAIVDNLHRANLRPGEEARAIAQLERLGMTHREIARRLGKSAAWVSQRLAIAKLPDAALQQLDSGAITREEALALSRLLDYPDLVEACLEPDGKRLKARVGGHVPEAVGERVQVVMRVLEMERQRESWVAKMRAEGHRVLDEVPRENDRRYLRLVPGSDLARAHQEARLSCEAWAWEHGRPVRYCTNPAVLRQAMANTRQTDPVEQARQEEHRRVLEREAARDAIVRAWLATSRGLERWELLLLARERIRSLTFSDDRVLARVGSWLGVTGDRAARVAAAKRELTGASERRLLQLWFAVEVAEAVSYSVIPAWAAPWLERLGFVDPHRPTQGLPGDVQAKEVDEAEESEGGRVSQGPAIPQRKLAVVPVTTQDVPGVSSGAIL